MKRLQLRDLKPDDSLRLDFEGAFDPQAALESELEPFLRALEEYAGEWMPDVAESKQRRRYSRAAVWKALEEERDERSTSIVLGRMRRARLRLEPSSTSGRTSASRRSCAP